MNTMHSEKDGHKFLEVMESTRMVNQSLVNVFLDDHQHMLHMRKFDGEVLHKVK